MKTDDYENEDVGSTSRSSSHCDTELRDLVAQNLRNKGILGKMKAELRANVYLALEQDIVRYYIHYFYIHSSLIHHIFHFSCRKNLGKVHSEASMTA